MSRPDDARSQLARITTALVVAGTAVGLLALGLAPALAARHGRVTAVASAAAQAAAAASARSESRVDTAQDRLLAEDLTPPSAPTALVATSGAAPVFAKLTWRASTDRSGVAGYRVFRSFTAEGPFEAIGTTGGPAYDDRSGVPGQAYVYQVAAYDAAANESPRSPVAGPVTVTWTRPPHASYSEAAQLCTTCHVTHDATPGGNLVRDTGTGATAGGRTGEVGLCFDCHDGTGAAANVRSGRMNSFAQLSGHAVEDVGARGDVTDTCSACHSPHKDYRTTPNLWRGRIGNAVVTGDNTTWCLACHATASTWYRGTYPSLAAPLRDASGYPVLGTFPGGIVAADPERNAHASIEATAGREQGDCRWCHASHRGPNRYDSLVATFAPPSIATAVADRTGGDYAALCLRCHGSRDASTGPTGVATVATVATSSVAATESTSATASVGTTPAAVPGMVDPSVASSGAVDIARFVLSTADDLTSNAGHRIRTAGGLLPVGASLPCYECHAPHGSARGNADMIADSLGAKLSTKSASGVRDFCLSCHVTSDGKAWDSMAATLTAVPTTATVVGLKRNGDGGNRLKLVDNPGAHESASTKSCYVCHGDDYTDPDGHNVHDPSPGLSTGGRDCYGCHAELRSSMEDSLGVERGTTAAASYHHVLGTAQMEGDFAPGFGVYPTGVQDVLCTSCHLDHNYFNGRKAANLRASYDSTVAAATDFSATSPYGVCIGCHEVERVGDPVDRATRPGATHTSAISPAGYAASAHSYGVTSTFSDGSQFSADCAKCHSDERSKPMQSGANRFGTHASAVDTILATLGVLDLLGPPEERACFACHSQAGSDSSTDAKATAGTDRFQVSPMSAASESIARSFAQPHGHNVAAYKGRHLSSPTDETLEYLAANRHVECGDCHDVHAAGKGQHAAGSNAVSPVLAGASGVAVSFADTDWTVPGGFTLLPQATKEYEICLKCHSSANTSSWSWGGAGAQAWTDLARDISPANVSGHPVAAAQDARSNGTAPLALAASDLRAPWSAKVGSQTMYCSDCHADDAAQGAHGSPVRWMLSGPNKAWPYLSAADNGSSEGQYYTLDTMDAGDGLFCRNCHVLDPAANPVHASHRGVGAACVDCHVRVPHGASGARLIAVTGSGSWPGSLDPRLTADGQGGHAGRSTATITRFMKPATRDGSTKASCSTTGESATGVACHTP